jgi:glycosyltransferase involved in cell wall biosynthesis
MSRLLTNLKNLGKYYHYRLLRILKRIPSNFYIIKRLERAKNRKLLEQSRASSYETGRNDKPLVSVVIHTYNNSRELTERAIPSVLRQTYKNLEIIVVGDHCTDDTAERIGTLAHDKLTFYNLPKRGDYPQDPFKKWLVAGVVPANKALDMATGEWIAPLDDDDEFTDDHVEVLLNFALQGDYEMVYGKVLFEGKDGEPEWCEVGRYPPQESHISRISTLYQAKLTPFKYDIKAWKFYEPADWNLWRRMKEAGVRIGFIDQVVGLHYG